MIERFGSLQDGRNVDRVHLENADLDLSIVTYGASIQSLSFKNQPVVLGSDDINDYLGPLTHFGAIVGRVANRLAHAKATIDGVEHVFDANEVSGSCLHGGADGSGRQLWTVVDHGKTHAVLALDMPDGHMGFPGNLHVEVRYEIQNSALEVGITATTDRETLCSFASHAYWNLSGEGNINAHEMIVRADDYLPIDGNKIPTGDVASVAKTSFDFREARELRTVELDHNFCVSTNRTALRPVLRLSSAQSGIVLDVLSTESGVQVYDGRHFGRAGLAIEPQVWPDAINQNGFPSMCLKPGETYKAVTVFKLSKPEV